MLNSFKRFFKAVLVTFTLQVIISLVAFQGTVLASAKNSKAEEFRLKGFEEQQKGNLDAALDFYSKAISAGLNDAAVYNDMGVLYEQIGFRSKAEQYYLQAVKINSEYLPPYMNLAFLYQKNGMTEKAFQYFKIRYEQSASDDPWGQRAREELIKIHPEYKDEIMAREVQEINDQLNKKAEKEFYDSLLRSNEHYSRGESLFDKGDYKEAIKEYNNAIALSPNNPKILNAREKAFFELMKEDVEGYYAQAMKALKTGDTVTAREKIRKMLSMIPNKPLKVSDK